MSNIFFEDFQYDSCVSRGICSISPRISALQTIIVLYLRLFAKFATQIELDSDTKIFILNIISITINNSEFNDKSFINAIEKFRTIFNNILINSNNLISKDEIELEKNKIRDLLNKTSSITDSIQYGEKVYNKALINISEDKRNLYNIILVIAKSLSINLIELESFDKENKDAYNSIIEILNEINLNNNISEIKSKIKKAAEIDIKLMEEIRFAQENRYGKQQECEVSFSTVPNKAVLVVGSNIRELETILDALKNENIDIYTHDDMMLAHTFPKFSNYSRLKGQFGQGLENCLLDFATFPGPIILTKHSLHNIENFYRGRLFTTDYISSPKGIIKIYKEDFSKVIESAKTSKGFKNGKLCESIKIGYNQDKIKNTIKSKINSNKFKRIFLIGAESYSLEQRSYFEKLFKLTPNDTLILSFSYNIEKENLIYINTCFDNYSWIKIFNLIKDSKFPIRIFIPKCERNTISQIIYLSKFKNIKIYLGKCTPIALNPTLINTLQSSFNIKQITSAKKDLEEILTDK